eukprot:8259344-Karenia_brevis.AAC.1
MSFRRAHTAFTTVGDCRGRPRASIGTRDRLRDTGHFSRMQVGQPGHSWDVPLAVGAPARG